MVDLTPIKPNVMDDKEDSKGRDREQLEDGSIKVRMFTITNNDEAARLIGLGGETVTKLRKEYAEVKLRIGSKVPGVDEQVTEVDGPIERVTELLMRIAEITTEPRSNDQPLLTLLVHNAGGLIGTGGERVTRIRKESGATIKIAKDNLARSSQTPVTVTGRLESVEKATRMILEFISTCEPVDIVYSPEMSLDRRDRDGRWGGGWRRRDSSRGRRGGDYRDGRGFSGGDRLGGRRGDFGRREVGGGWGRYDERDFGYRGGRWGNRDGDSWGGRDDRRDARDGGGYRGGSGGGWGGGASRDRERGIRHDDYDPFKPSSSRRSAWAPSNGGWDGPGPRSGGGWQTANGYNERGWGKPKGIERGWGPSRSAGGGVDWGGPPERSRRDYGGPRGSGNW